MTQYNACRFCQDTRQGLVHYGVRHYAHYECYIKAGKSLDDLHAWQVGQFPYRVLKMHGLEKQAEKMMGAK
jgi:hypothetical protein